MGLEGGAGTEGGEARVFGLMMLWTRRVLALGSLGLGMYVRLGIGRGCVEGA